MKLKARDLVKGWPRGRSTSRFDSWKWKLDPFFLRINEPREEFIREGLADERYHQAQREMVDGFFERYRHPVPDWAVRIAGA